MSSKMNSRGVTLVEVMISMVILLVVFMGLIQASLLSINHNMRNEVRDEAVRVAAASMSLLRSFNYSCAELGDPSVNPFVSLINVPLVNGGNTADYANCRRVALTATQIDQIKCPQRSFRNLTLPPVDLSCPNGGYKVTKGVDWLDGIRPQPNTKRLTVTVQWRYPGDDPAAPPQSHTIYYTLRNPVQ